MTTTTPAAGPEERNGIEVRARTVDEAVARGLVRLGGLSRTEVKIEVINPGKGGLLGFGAEEAVVRLIPLPPGERSEETYVISTPPADTELPPAPEATPAPSGPDEVATSIAAEAQPPTTGGRRPEPAPGRDTVTRASRRGVEDGPPPGVPAAVPTDADEAMARDIVLTLLGHLGFGDVSLETQDTLLPVPLADEAALVIGIRGPGTDRLLAHADRSLYALQFIARLMLNRHTEGWTNLLLDVNGDRARRLKEIYHMAEQSAQLVEREGRPVSLPPMSPYERRVVHLALKDHGTIGTQSIGTGPNRKVTVRRKDQMLPDL